MDHAVRLDAGRVQLLGELCVGHLAGHAAARAHLDAGAALLHAAALLHRLGGLRLCILHLVEQTHRDLQSVFGTSVRWRGAPGKG